MYNIHIPDIQVGGDSPWYKTCSFREKNIPCLLVNSHWWPKRRTVPLSFISTHTEIIPKKDGSLSHNSSCSWVYIHISRSNHAVWAMVIPIHSGSSKNVDHHKPPIRIGVWYVCLISLVCSYCGWLRNPASPWLKHVETLWIMGCLPPDSTGAGFRNHPLYHRIWFPYHPPYHPEGEAKSAEGMASLSWNDAFAAARMWLNMVKEWLIMVNRW